jgi:hypothetical protein
VVATTPSPNTRHQRRSEAVTQLRVSLQQGLAGGRQPPSRAVEHTDRTGVEPTTDSLSRGADSQVHDVVVVEQASVKRGAEPVAVLRVALETDLAGGRQAIGRAVEDIDRASQAGRPHVFAGCPHREIGEAVGVEVPLGDREAEQVDRLGIALGEQLVGPR